VQRQSEEFRAVRTHTENQSTNSVSDCHSFLRPVTTFTLRHMFKLSYLRNVPTLAEGTVHPLAPREAMYPPCLASDDVAVQHDILQISHTWRRIGQVVRARRLMPQKSRSAIVHAFFGDHSLLKLSLWELNQPFQHQRERERVCAIRDTWHVCTSLCLYAGWVYCLSRQMKCFIELTPQI
jgi:hypothetical protein